MDRHVVAMAHAHSACVLVSMVGMDQIALHHQHVTLATAVAMVTATPSTTQRISLHTAVNASMVGVALTARHPLSVPMLAHWEQSRLLPALAPVTHHGRLTVVLANCHAFMALSMLHAASVHVR